jgi:gamma-glutamylcyclotransferase (GGCT)/AIG2-like uncharacterized protein YtfP
VTDRLFVYGTLAPGNDAWSVLEPWVVGEPVADAVAGQLYDTGRGYPGATFGAGPNLVHGRVVLLGEPDAALAALDRYEGDEYARITVRTRAGVDVAAYAWTAPLTGCRPVPGGRWRDPEAHDSETSETRRADDR